MAVVRDHAFPSHRCGVAERLHQQRFATARRSHKKRQFSRLQNARDIVQDLELFHWNFLPGSGCNRALHRINRIVRKFSKRVEGHGSLLPIEHLLPMIKRTEQIMYVPVLSLDYDKEHTLYLISGHPDRY